MPVACVLWVVLWTVSTASFADCSSAPGSQLPEMLQRVGFAVVNLRTSDASVGSGFLVADGLVVTSAHLAAEEDLWVEVPDAGRQRWQGLSTDDELDLAIGRIAAPGDACLDLREDQPRLGETVYALGNPFGLGLTVTRGIISAEPRAIGKTHRVQTDAAINPGNSGGPLIDTNGRVVGVVSARAAIGSGIGFAVPVNTLRELLRVLP